MPKLIDVYTTLKYDLRVTVVRSEVGQMDTHTHTYIYIVYVCIIVHLAYLI